MKIQFKKAGVEMFLFSKRFMFCCAIAGAIAANGRDENIAGQPDSGSHGMECFLEDMPASAIGDIHFYNRIPDLSKAISNDGYEYLATIVSKRLKLQLRPEWVPESSFIVENIKLFPAGVMATKEDVAFLRYEMAGRAFMVVSTGGINGCSLIFVKNRNAIENKDDAVVRFLRDYIRADFKEKLPDFEPARRGNVTVGISCLARLDDEKIEVARLLIAGDEACFIYRFALEPTPAREPYGDHWFEWEKKKSMEMVDFKTKP